MNGSMRHEFGVPLIPAPVAFFALMFGLMLGVGIGRRKAMMYGMHGGGKCGGAMMRPKMMICMMGPMGMHHHHGDGTPQCTCGERGEGAGHGRERTEAE